MSFCRLNAKQFAVVAESAPGEITEGSQYNNAVMHHDADKVIVL